MNHNNNVAVEAVVKEEKELRARKRVAPAGASEQDKALVEKLNAALEELAKRRKVKRERATKRKSKVAEWQRDLERAEQEIAKLDTMGAV